MRLVGGLLLIVGVVVFVVSPWMGGTPVTVAGAVLLLAGAAIDPGTGRLRVTPAGAYNAVWMSCGLAFLLLGGDVEAGGVETWLGAISGGMLVLGWLPFLAAAWGSWLRAVLFALSLGPVLALAQVDDELGGAAFAGWFLAGLWGWPGFRGWERALAKLRRPGRFRFFRGNVRLAGHDTGGKLPPVLVLHGLAGDGREWEPTVAALRDRFRVVTLDARGHGDSEHHPGDVSRAAHVADVIAAIEHRRLPPVSLVGQSLGGQTAICVAAARPDLVRTLVVVEAGPWGQQFDAAGLAALGERLRAKPIQERLHFDSHVMERTMAAFDAEDCWDEWGRVACPVLLVLGEDGGFAPGEAEEMLARQPLARAVTIEGAGHDVHLDRPDEWQAVLSQYLTEAR